MDELFFYEKNVYGNLLVYPSNHADTFQELTGKKTANPGDLAALKKYGFVVMVKREKGEVDKI